MLMFLATLGISAGAALLVQALDIECVKPAKPRRSLRQSVQTEVKYPDGAAAGALR